MNTRRSFFSRIAGMVAVVAIAPELAFRAKLALPQVETFWTQDQCYSRTYSEEYLNEITKWEWTIVERGDYYVMEIL